MTALPVETSEVLGQLDGEATTVEDLAGRVVTVGHFTPGDGRRWRVVVIETGPGNIDTAGVTAQAISAFQPAAALFVGIAGALKAKDLSLGDVVAGSEVAWTERGKSTDKGFLARIVTAPGSIALTSWARRIIQQQSWRHRAHDAQTSKAVVGQIASGEQVVASSSEREQLARTFSDALAIENEGWGFARTAGNFGTPAMVVRGISDVADADKSDTHQSLAANHAAAFAFEVLDGFSGALNIDDPESGAEVEQPIEAAPHPAGKSAHFEDIATDPDLLEDDENTVVGFGLDLARESGIEVLRSFLTNVAEELETTESPLLRRRMVWLAETVIKFGPARVPDEELALEQLVKQHPASATMILTDPAVWNLCAPVTRRRVLTHIIGPSDTARPPDENGARVLVTLWIQDQYSEKEATRVRDAFALMNYQDLQAVDVPLSLVIDRILGDLESGDFDHQNPAARYLYRRTSSDSSDLTEAGEFRLGAELVDAATGVYSSNGAKEALDFSFAVAWPRGRVMGAFSATLVYPSTQDLRATPGAHIGTLLAVATTNGFVDELLEDTKTRIGAAVGSATHSVREMLADELGGLTGRMQGPAIPSWENFVNWIRMGEPNGGAS
jgi:adenosylhomocysteine nucleosidase